MSKLFKKKTFFFKVKSLAPRQKYFYRLSHIGTIKNIRRAANEVAFLIRGPPYYITPSIYKDELKRMFTF